MSISDAQYTAWLANERSTRCLLVDVQYRASSGTIVYDYLSTHPYVTTPTDTLANTPYRNVVTSIPQFTQEMSDVLIGRTTPSTGSIVVDNGDGALDAWLTANFAGRPLTLYLGSPDWPKADFRAVWTGVMAGITVQRTTSISIEARARDHLLTQDVITTKYTSGGSDGKYKPLAYGACYNVSPLFIGTSTSDYKYAVNAADVYAISEVRVNGVASAGYNDNNDGTFTFYTGDPGGQVTCDIEGMYSGGTRFRTLKTIIKDLCVTRGPFVEADFESVSWAALETTFPQYLGLYLEAPVKYYQALDLLCASVGAFYCVTRDGKILIGKFQLSGTATLELGPDQIVAQGLSVVKVYQPLDNLRRGYARQWTTQANFGDNDPSVDVVKREKWRNEYAWVASTNSGAANLLKTLDPNPQGTLLTTESDCQTEADRWMGIWGNVRVRYSVECFLDGAQVNLGDRVKLTHPRLGLSAGVTGTVVKFTDRPSKRRQLIEVLT